MNQVRISDMTMRRPGRAPGFTLTFKEKLELAGLLDRLGVSVIEIDGLTDDRADALRIKSIAAAVKTSAVAVPVAVGGGNAAATWDALGAGPRCRLQAEIPVSPVQMEYLLHKKPAALLETVAATVRACRALTENVEFVADDATRSDEAFLSQAVKTAIAEGASTVTVCDSAGTMLPEEFEAFLDRLLGAVPELEGICLGVACSNDLAMADACAMAAVRRGAGELKVTACRSSAISLANAVKAISVKGEALGVCCGVSTTELKRITGEIEWICRTEKSRSTPFDNSLQTNENVTLTKGDDMQEVLEKARQLGYDLSEEDGAKVWEAFERIASRKQQMGSRELDAIIAAAAMQAPAAYQVESYVVNTGSIITAMAHVKLRKQNKVLEGISAGDGPIDAAFLAIEQIMGRHYELDDFQIQAVTRGREAMGQTVVKLRSNGKLYSGRGISTDIVESGIRAYVNALNKIAYEEEEE